MTDREKAIVMAYTGKCMLTGDKLHIFYEYVEEIMGRPVYTHEMGIKAVDDEIREKAKADFVALCRDESSSENPNRWIPVSEKLPEKADCRYWVCTDTGYQCQCRWTDDVYGLGSNGKWAWKIFDIPQYSHVVAWMPLPEPYRAESEEQE